MSGLHNSDPHDKLRIEFVCTGNICRSPMAHVIFEHALAHRGITGVEVSSSGTGDWHVGQKADSRARAELAAHNYDGESVLAETISPRTFEADLIVALDTGHRSTLIARGADANKVVLLRDFDPAAAPDSSVADPYYGAASGFSTTREQIEAAVPGMIEWVIKQQS